MSTNPVSSTYKFNIHFYQRNNYPSTTPVCTEVDKDLLFPVYKVLDAAIVIISFIKFEDCLKEMDNVLTLHVNHLS